MEDYSRLVQEIRENTRGSIALDLSKRAANAIEDLTHIHQMDLSETVRLRREVEKLTEEARTPG